MKCRYCGSNLGIEDEYCPYCGKVNDQAAGHQAVMKDYLNEFERTKTEAKVKSITAGRIGRFVVIGLMLIGRAGGLAGVWAAVGWVILFCLLTALIAVDGNWIMTSLSMTCLVICFFLFLYGLVTLYGEMGKQIKAGRGVKAAYADACRSKIKFLAILYGVVLLIGLVLMVAFKAGMYGILGRIVAVSALLSFVVLFVCIRVVLGCWSAVTAKN